MIVLFSANECGGILQFVSQILRELSMLGRDVVCFVPEKSIISVPDNFKNQVIRYKKVKTCNLYNHQIEEVALSILYFQPTLVWMFDNSILSSQLSLLLRGKVRQAVIMHDAGIFHPTHNNTMFQRINQFVRKTYSRCANKVVDYIVTLSPQSKSQFIKLYPKLTPKVLLLALGAHVPDCTAICPKEIERIDSFNLFFGRLDKYKGFDTLVRTYRNGKLKTKLIIAGNGTLLESEERMILQSENIILIKRYISDNEMKYLFERARAVVLPYKEATQSGVIPISYCYGKPVICSNIPGLTQFVKQNITGLICNNELDYIAAYNLLENNSVLMKMGKCAKKYYNDNLEWRNNLLKLAEEIGVL